MARPVKYLGIGTPQVVPATSRFSNKQVISYGDEGKVTFSTYNKIHIPPSPNDKYFEINKYYEFRPDLVSAHFFGVPDYWWRIMEVNNMKDILEFRSGRNIRLPNVLM